MHCMRVACSRPRDGCSFPDSDEADDTTPRPSWPQRDAAMRGAMRVFGHSIEAGEGNPDCHSSDDRARCPRWTKFADLM